MKARQKEELFTTKKHQAREASPMTYWGEEVVHDADDLSIYAIDTRMSMLDDDELSPREEAFMNGYEEANDNRDAYT